MSYFHHPVVLLNSSCILLDRDVVKTNIQHAKKEVAPLAMSSKKNISDVLICKSSVSLQKLHTWIFAMMSTKKDPYNDYASLHVKMGEGNFIDSIHT